MNAAGSGIIRSPQKSFAVLLLRFMALFAFNILGNSRITNLIYHNE